MSAKKIPSDAQNPDLDWSQIRETVMMLNVALSQVERSLTEGDESINALTKLFTALMGKFQVIQMASETLPDSREKTAVMENCRSVSAMINEVVVAFQFYDKMAQRLSHVSLNLSALADLINDGHRLYSPFEWSALQEMIKSKYFIDADRQMFNAILDGASVKEALDIGDAHRRRNKEQDNVEVF
ncbi:MAG: hypothetical protein ACLFPD_05810 [Desulfosudaceae bacterium]